MEDGGGHGCWRDEALVMRQNVGVGVEEGQFNKGEEYQTCRLHLASFSQTEIQILMFPYTEYRLFS